MWAKSLQVGAGCKLNLRFGLRVYISSPALLSRNFQYMPKYSFISTLFSRGKAHIFYLCYRSFILTFLYLYYTYQYYISIDNSFLFLIDFLCKTIILAHFNTVFMCTLLTFINIFGVFQRILMYVDMLQSATTNS